MRIIAFSDWRIQSIEQFIKYLEESGHRPDVIIYAGDDVGRFNNVPKTKIPKEFRDVKFPKVNHFQKIAALSKYGLVAVAGNDDYPFEKYIIRGKKVYNIHEEPLIIGDYAFIGLEGATTPPGTLLHSEDYVLKHLNASLEKVPEKIIIIVSHSPPYEILDFAVRFGAEPIGSTSLKEFINKNHKQLAFIFCGHCHLQGGKHEIYKSVSIFNCASHDNKGAPGKVLDISIRGRKLIGGGFRKLYDFETEELLSINGIGRKRFKALIEAGITNIKELANANPNDKRFNTRVFAGQYGLMVNQAKSIVQNKILIIKKHSFFKDLDKKNIFFFDSEYNTIPTVKVGIFLLGWMDTHGNYQQLFIDNPKNEKKVLEKFKNWLIEEDPILICYNSKGADRPHLIKNFKKYDMPTDLLSNKRFF
ncbi:MAG: metallophosphoesterase, partial [Candidatus Hodarchaeota archaeon]